MPYLKPDTALYRFLAKVEITDGCWTWRGCSQRGYGVVRRGGKKLRAHRYSYELFVGTIPEGLTLDHYAEIRSASIQST